jgi:hypothetical protein
MEHTAHAEKVTPEKTSHSGHDLTSPLALLKQAWDFYAKNWKVFLGLTLIPFAVAIIIGLIFILGGLVVAMLPLPMAFKIGLAIAYGIVSLAVLIYVGTLSSGAQILFLADQSEKTFVDRLKGARPYFWGAVWIQVITVFAILGGTIALILPGIYLSVVLYFATFVYYLEHKKGISALIGSQSLSKGHFWGIFWRGLVVGIIILVLVMVLSFAISGNFANIVMTVIGAPIILIYYFMLYRDLKKHHGDHDHGVSKWCVTIFAWIGAVVLVAAAFFVPFFITKMAMENKDMMNSGGLNMEDYMMQDGSMPYDMDSMMMNDGSEY